MVQWEIHGQWMVEGIVVGTSPLNLYSRIFIEEKPLVFLAKNDVIVQEMIM